MTGDPLFRDDSHTRTTHERWSQRLNRAWPPEAYRDEWRVQQCGNCRYWVPLAGDLGSDWGACSNDGSPFDQRAMFEPDGCPAHEPADEWVSRPDG